MNQKNILLLFGGVSPEHEISIASATSVMNTITNHRVIPVYITREGKWLLYDGKLDNVPTLNWEKFGVPAVLSTDRTTPGLLRIAGDKAKLIPVDVVLPILHGPNGEDGTIQGLCEVAGLPYIGCGVLASAVAMDKATTKLIAKALKIPQGDFLVFEDTEINSQSLTKIGRKLGYPCFVKPSVGGSSIGISKANDRKELTTAIETALQYCHKIVIEKAIPGREIEIGVLGEGANAKTSVTGEIIADGEFYDFDAKYTKPASQTLVPANVPEAIQGQIQKYALEIFKGIGGRGLSRVDFFVTEDGKIYLNEINTMPGFTAISMYAKMWETSGVNPQELIEILLAVALNAHGQ